jgi:hypothetical protein
VKAVTVQVSFWWSEKEDWWNCQSLAVFGLAVLLPVELLDQVLGQGHEQ